MSLSIDTNAVAAVLLPDGEWHDVVEDSFDLDAYEYVQLPDKNALFGGAQDRLIPATGARWKERVGDKGLRSVYCPLSGRRCGRERLMTWS